MITLQALPDPKWPVVLLLAVQAFDTLLVLKPPAFIRGCFDGVGFPREWWWVMPIVKGASAIGLATGLLVPGVALATTAAIIVYFAVAIAAHIRAKFLGVEFWANCLGMFALSAFVLVVSFVRLR